MARYLVGIDLGTTNNALAYIDLRRRVHNGRPEINTFAIPQLVNWRMQAAILVALLPLPARRA